MCLQDVALPPPEKPVPSTGAPSVPASSDSGITYSGVEGAPQHVRYDFVLTGYRYNYSGWQGLTGLFELHFETLNIWSHLLGLGWFLAQYPRLRDVLAQANAARIDYVYYYGFLACAVFQMGTSTVYHTWRSMSPAWETALLRLDVVGVAAMIIGSYAVGLLNGFWCDPWLHGACDGGACYVVRERRAYAGGSGVPTGRVRSLQHSVHRQRPRQFSCMTTRSSSEPRPYHQL